MLVLSRRINERIIIEGGVTVTVLEIRKDRIRLGIEAPGMIDREEVWLEKQRKEQERAKSTTTNQGNPAITQGNRRSTEGSR